MIRNDTCLVILFIASLIAQTSRADTLRTNTVLYKITHPQNQHISYLFGTHHAFDKPFFESLVNAKDALLSSEVCIKENLNIPGHLAVDIINNRTGNTRWKKYVSAEDHSFILNLFSSSGLQFDKMTPAELFAFLTRHYKERICVEKDPNAAYFSLDDYIGSLARKSGLQVIGLETSEDQVAMINQDVAGMPRKVHRKRIAGMIERIQQGTRDQCGEIEWYRNMNFDYKLDQPCRNKLLLIDRNKSWLRQLRNHFSSSDCFVAVGMSHLMFDCGLIRQLQEAGYMISPVYVR